VEVEVEVEVGSGGGISDWKNKIINF
jgi:hypothetical protein